MLQEPGFFAPVKWFKSDFLCIISMLVCSIVLGSLENYTSPLYVHVHWNVFVYMWMQEVMISGWNVCRYSKLAQVCYSNFIIVSLKVNQSEVMLK